MIELSQNGFQTKWNKIMFARSKIDVRFCSISEFNRTIGDQLGSNEFWLDFV